jgi:hypothetical protein
MKMFKMKMLFTSSILLIILMTCHLTNAQPGSYLLIATIPEDVRDIKEAKGKIAAILNEAKNLEIDGFKVEKITYTDDEITFQFKKNQSKTLYYKDILPGKILVENVPLDAFLRVTNNKNPAILRGPKGVLLMIAPYLLYIQKEENKKRIDEEYKQFEPIAAKYRETAPKPVMSEEQRKYIVQANAMAQDKNYAIAKELYYKALEISITDCPDAYSNLALLEAQTGNYAAALINMKKYLLLVPEAPDARSAQDKIYEWELRFTNVGV